MNQIIILILISVCAIICTQHSVANISKINILLS